MRYLNYQVVFKEVPDEVTLSINITNCPYRCPGCHSSYLQEDVGEELTFETLSSLIEKHKGITCVCFMGGDRNTYKLLTFAYFIKIEYGLKTAWYSGMDTMPERLIENVKDVLNYVKIGSYKKDRGGLESRETNQQFFKVEDSKLIEIKLWK